MPMWWNENDCRETALTFAAAASPSQMVGGISGQMSTAPVRSACVITSSFWNRIQETFVAAGALPHHELFLVTSIDVPLIQFTNLYGPVPTGLGLANFWICPAVIA